MNNLLQQIIPGAFPLFKVKGAHLLALKVLIENTTSPGWEILYNGPTLSTQILLECPVKIQK